MKKKNINKNQSVQVGTKGNVTIKHNYVNIHIKCKQSKRIN